MNGSGPVSGATGDITPDTHVKMPLTRVVAIVGAIVVGTVFLTGIKRGVEAAIDAIGNKVAAHIENREVHIDAGYQFDHGRPVGKWDVDAANADTKRAIGELRQSIDDLRNALVNQRHR